MSRKKNEKLMSTLIITPMLFSSFSVLVSSSYRVVHHAPSWLEKIGLSLRGAVLKQSNGTAGITVLTTDAGLLKVNVNNLLDLYIIIVTIIGIIAVFIIGWKFSTKTRNAKKEGFK